MSRWTIAVASLTVIAFSSPPAIAAEDDTPPNIELKPGAAAAAAATDKGAEDAGSGVKTRQIVTEGKDASPAEAPKAGAAAAPPPPADTAAKPEAPKAANQVPEPEQAGAPPAPPAGAPSPENKEAAAPPLRPEEVVIAVQTELKRVGCDPGEADGVWGGHSREALAAFGHFAKVDVADLAPTPQILGIIKGKTAIVCAAEAEGGESAHHAEPSHGYGSGGYGGGGGGY
jgi:hypothetical protein